MIGSTELKVETLQQIGKLEALSGLNPLGTAESMPDSTSKAAYWLAISDALREAHQSEQADNAIAKAQANADAIERPYEKSLVLGEIALRLVAMEQPDKAEPIFTRSVATIGSIEGNYNKARALLSLALKYQTTGREPNEEERHLLRDIVLRLE